jgi:FMN reductase
VTLLAINGSPSASSKTRALADAAARLGDGSVLDIGAIDADALLLRGGHPTLDDALARIAAADRVVLATPIYRATYSGLLKVLLDQLPQDGLAGKGVVLVATGGSPVHYLGLDTGLRAAVASVQGWSVPTVVYATGADFDESGAPSEKVVATLASALDEASRVGGVSPG